jgi:cation-transporting ATPase 13A3/4/5
MTEAGAHKCERETVESDLEFIGFLIMENKLKPETAAVIKTLQEAEVRTVMATGDNILTAMSVAA